MTDDGLRERIEAVLAADDREFNVSKDAIRSVLRSTPTTPHRIQSVYTAIRAGIVNATTLPRNTDVVTWAVIKAAFMADAATPAAPQPDRCEADPTDHRWCRTHSSEWYRDIDPERCYKSRAAAPQPDTACGSMRPECLRRDRNAWNDGYDAGVLQGKHLAADDGLREALARADRWVLSHRGKEHDWACPLCHPSDLIGRGDFTCAIHEAEARAALSGS